jgi:hypothetical protein
MKSIKTFIIALVLGLSGVAYAAGSSQALPQSCCLKGADCCVVGANCCAGGACCAAREAR